jgi:hypothetical protein
MSGNNDSFLDLPRAILIAGVLLAYRTRWMFGTAFEDMVAQGGLGEGKPLPFHLARKGVIWTVWYYTRDMLGPRKESDPRFHTVAELKDKSNALCHRPDRFGPNLLYRDLHDNKWNLRCFRATATNPSRSSVIEADSNLCKMKYTTDRTLHFALIPTIPTMDLQGNPNLIISEIKSSICG